MTDNTFVEPKRARRIRDKQRMKRRARWVAKNVWSYSDDFLSYAEKRADYIKVCSCWMCGNQTKWHGPRMGDIRKMVDADLYTYRLLTAKPVAHQRY